jgi:predicted RNase H-like HicB family nuclease
MKAAANIVRFAVVIVKTEGGYAAAVPDLLGCSAQGPTVGLVQHAIREAVDRHVANLREKGLPLPDPTSQIAYVEVGAPVAG